MFSSKKLYFQFERSAILAKKRHLLQRNKLININNYGYLKSYFNNYHFLGFKSNFEKLIQDNIRREFKIIELLRPLHLSEMEFPALSG
jgi:hypothetical protein